MYWQDCTSANQTLSKWYWQGSCAQSAEETPFLQTGQDLDQESILALVVHYLSARKIGLHFNLAHIETQPYKN